VLAAAVLAGAGCGSTKQARVERGPVLIEKSSRKAPSWTTKVPKKRGNLFFVGTSSTSETLDQGRNLAAADAFRQIMEAVGIRVSGSTSVHEEYRETYRAVLEGELFTEGKARLRNAELEQTYFEKYRRPDGSLFYQVWVLVRYAREDLEQEQARLAELEQQKLNEAEDRAASAAGQLESGLFWQAVTGYIDAAAAAARAPDGELLFDRYISRAAALLSGFQVKPAEPASPPPSGMIGGPLDAPLQVEVLYTADGRHGVPAAGVPVVFSWQMPGKRADGYKTRIEHRVTDKNGRAELMIERIQQVGTVPVRADIETTPLIDSLGALTEGFGSRTGILRTSSPAGAGLLFAADSPARHIPTAVYFLQHGPEGELVTAPLTAPAVYETLFELGFQVRVPGVDPRRLEDFSERQIAAVLSLESGDWARRVLFGNVFVTGFDEVGGYPAARASAEALLVDLDSESLIRSWQTSASGTGKTREEAARTALIEVGKDLGQILARTMP
jgi:hypothetical protein